MLLCSKLDSLKCDMGRKLMSNLAFLTPLKFRGGAGEIESILRLQPRTKTLIYFWWNAARLSRRSECGRQDLLTNIQIFSTALLLSPSVTLQSTWLSCVQSTSHRQTDSETMRSYWELRVCVWSEPDASSTRRTTCPHSASIQRSSRRAQCHHHVKIDRSSQTRQRSATHGHRMSWLMATDTHKATGHNLWQRAHNQTLPSDVGSTSKQNFIARMLFTDMYWSVLPRKW